MSESEILECVGAVKAKMSCVVCNTLQLNSHKSRIDSCGHYFCGACLRHSKETFRCCKCRTLIKKSRDLIDRSNNNNIIASLQGIDKLLVELIDKEICETSSGDDESTNEDNRKSTTSKLKTVEKLQSKSSGPESEDLPSPMKHEISNDSKRVLLKKKSKSSNVDASAAKEVIKDTANINARKRPQRRQSQAAVEILGDKLFPPIVVNLSEDVARTPPIKNEPIIDAAVKRSARIQRRISVMLENASAIHDDVKEINPKTHAEPLKKRRQSVMQENASAIHDDVKKINPKTHAEPPKKRRQSVMQENASAIHDNVKEINPKTHAEPPKKRFMQENASAIHDDVKKINPKTHAEPPKKRFMQENANAIHDDVKKINPKTLAEPPKKRRQSVMQENASPIHDDVKEINPKTHAEPLKTRRKSAMKKSVENISQNDKVDDVLLTPPQPVNVKVLLTRSSLIDRQTLTLSGKSLPETKSPLKPINSSTSKLSLNKEKKVEKKNFKGETQLQIACRSGNKTMVCELLAKGANPNHSDNAKWTPLHDATRNGSYAICELLIQNGAVVTIPGMDNNTALHIAVELGYEEIAKLLYSNNADLHAKNSRGQTPYELATPALRDIFNDMPIHSQSEAIENMSMLQSITDFENAYVVGVGLSKESATLLNKLAKIHKDRFTLDTKLSNKTTHVIIDAVENKCPLTVQVMQAIAQRLWIISSNWIYESNDNEDLLDMKDYEIDGVEGFAQNGPKNARISRLKKLPKLFNGCSIYFKGLKQEFSYSKSVVLNGNFLQNMVTESEGVVLRREPNPEHASDESKLPHYAMRGGKLEHCSHYIVYAKSTQPCYNMKHLKALPLAWFVDSLCNYQLVEPE